MARILITGGSGMVGSTLVRLLAPQHTLLVTYNKNLPADPEQAKVEWKRLDITDGKAVLALSAFSPELIIHCAAMTRVADCEAAPEAAEAVNVQGTKNVVALTEQASAYLVHFSTDMVFDGKQGQYTEASPVSPLNAYGRTKAAAERHVTGYARGLVLRLFPYAFDPEGRSFISGVLAALERGEGYTAFTDVTNSPVHLATVTDCILACREHGVTGILHLPGPDLSRYAFAKKAAENVGVSTERLGQGSVADIPNADLYPRTLTLRSTRLESLGLTIPSVEEMLRAFRAEWESFRNTA